jgi:hypothetical protein
MGTESGVTGFLTVTRLTVHHGADPDLDWLRTTVQQYNWYIRGERERPKPNPTAIRVLTEARDRYLRIAERLTPSAGSTTEPTDG